MHLRKRTETSYALRPEGCQREKLLDGLWLDFSAETAGKRYKIFIGSSQCRSLARSLSYRVLSNSLSSTFIVTETDDTMQEKLTRPAGATILNS